MEWIYKYWSHIGLTISAFWIVYKHFAEKKERNLLKKKEEHRVLIDVITKYKIILLSAHQNLLSDLSQYTVKNRNIASNYKQEVTNLKSSVKQLKKIKKECSSGGKRNCDLCQELVSVCDNKINLCKKIDSDISDFDLNSVFQTLKEKIVPFTLISNHVSGLKLFVSAPVFQQIETIDLNTSNLISYIDLFPLGKFSDKDILDLINDTLIKCEKVMNTITEEIKK